MTAIAEEEIDDWVQAIAQLHEGVTTDPGDCGRQLRRWLTCGRGSATRTRVLE
jgi:hypothetical protein